MKNTDQNFSFTRFPNQIIDRYLSKLNNSEWSILTLIIRKTIGFNKKTDKISLTQFQKGTGLTRNTVKSSIDGLLEKDLIDRYPSGNSFLYRLSEFPNESSEKSDSQIFDSKIIYPENSSEFEPKIDQNLNTQRETSKETEKNTTSSSIDTHVIELQMAWNSRFNRKIDLFDPEMVNHIRTALQKFSFGDIVSAMDNRLKADYYKTDKPELLHNPNCFFPYENTIRTDLSRRRQKLFTYPEMLDLIFKKGYRESDFKIREDKRDKEGNPMRELIV